VDGVSLTLIEIGSLSHVCFDLLGAPSILSFFRSGHADFRLTWVNDDAKISALRSIFVLHGGAQITSAQIGAATGFSSLAWVNLRAN